MEKNQYESTEEDETIINNSFTDTNSVYEDYNINPKMILFITEYMSLSLKEKISRYLLNNKIRSLKNPITSDTIFHYLCMNDDNYPLIKLMKPNSFEREQKNNLGQTILHISVHNKSYKILDYLLENGSNINSKDNKNNTILHMAVLSCDYNAINIILNYNPNITIINIYNETPFDIAIKMKNKDILNLLKKIFNEKEKKSVIIKNKNNYENKKFSKNKNTEKNNKSNLFNNISINNCSLDTKNETNSQSFNIYKKKIVTNKSKFFCEDKDKDNIKINKTVNLNTSLNENTCPKKYYRSLSPQLTSKFVYHKTSPKSITNNQYTLIEFDDDSEKDEYTPKDKYITQQKLNELDNNIEYFNYKSERSNHNYMSHKNIFCGNNIENNKIMNRTRNKYIPLHIINNYDNYDNTDYAIKGIRKTVVNRSPFSFYKNKNNFRKEDVCTQNLLQFLKEIGMINYGNILISEGFDDIDLILKQMDEGFPELDHTLKEIGIIPAGDRAKILIRLQEISNEFNFNFPFEEVYFKNNNSIKKWLDSIKLSQYNKNFENAGYQSFELLLIQMASKYKINENILNNDLFIFNDKDKKTILKSLIINSEKYVKELRKKGNIQRTYSKIVKKDSDNICIII